eukprot:19318-Heterococcus_DN1.PRE.3
MLRQNHVCHAAYTPASYLLLQLLFQWLQSEQLCAVDDATFNSLSCAVSATSSLSIRDISIDITTVVYDDSVSMANCPA